MIKRVRFIISIVVSMLAIGIIIGLEINDYKGPTEEKVEILK